MLTRAALVIALSLSLCVTTAPRIASAKGGSSIVAATISGGNLGAPKYVDIRLPDNLDDMFEIDAPSAGPSALPYELTLHYDFGDQGGRRDWSGRYDGKSTLYFPEDMIVGNGTWKAGWYTAVDVLANALSGALAPARPPLFPDAGSGRSGARGSAAGVVPMPILITLGFMGYYVLSVGLRTKRS